VKLVIAFVLLGACGGGGDDPIDAPAGTDGPRVVDAPPVTTDAFDITARPYDLFVPKGYVEGIARPLVVLLHGYGASGAAQEGYFQIEPVAEAETFFYAKPDGTPDNGSSNYWNATDACCDLDDSGGPDDVTYLRALIDDVAARYTIDPKRIYLVGHSNGGFMSHRMACDAADRIAAIVSLAGAVWDDPNLCMPSVPVSMAQVHGTDDSVIQYGGGSVFGQATYPAAMETFTTWAGIGNCTGTQNSAPLDLDGGLAGDETTVVQATGCTAGVGVELWSIVGGSHIPNLQPIWGQTVWDFFAAHPKP
jgi:polyhydroxybutyrate depolymerase